MPWGSGDGILLLITHLKHKSELADVSTTGVGVRTFDAGLREPAREAGFLVVDGGLAEPAREAGFAEAFDAGLLDVPAAFEAGLEAAFDGGLDAALDAGFAAALEGGFDATLDAGLA